MRLITSIFSPKGGVGKTTLALSLTKAAADSSDKKVCIVEFDFSPGDFVSILDLDRRKGIFEAVHENLEWALQRPFKENFDVLIGGYPDTYEMIKPEQFKSLLEKLNEKYDLVFIDLQPNFIEPAIDVFSMSKDILLILEDDYSVNSRAIGTVDWAKTHGFMDIKKIKLIVNKVTGKHLKYVNITDLKFPVLYQVPFFKHFSGFNDSRLLKHSQKMLSILFPDILTAPKKGFLFFGKNNSSTAIRVDNDAKDSDYNLKEIKNLENKNLKDDREDDIKMPTRVYVNTGIKQLDEIISKDLNISDSLSGCDIAVISHISNPDYIKDLIRKQKKVILLADGSDSELISVANQIGITDIFYSPIDPRNIIEAIIKEIVRREGEASAFKNMPVKEQENSSKEYKEEKEHEVFYVTETTQNGEIKTREENTPDKNEIPEKIQEQEIHDDKENTKEGDDLMEVKENIGNNTSEYTEINNILEQIKNILAQNKKIYEERLMKQDEIIKEKEEELRKLAEKIQEQEKLINELKEKDTKRKQILEQLQQMLMQ